jgi:hypothetical protein
VQADIIVADSQVFTRTASYDMVSDEPGLKIFFKSGRELLTSYLKLFTGMSVGSTPRHLLSRTPTTRSDPSEFKASQDDSYVRYYAVRPDGRVVPENKENSNWTLERRYEHEQAAVNKTLNLQFVIFDDFRLVELVSVM